MRREEFEQGGSDWSNEFLYVPHELVVHRHDSERLKGTLERIRTASTVRAVGAVGGHEPAFEVWTLAAGHEDVPALVKQLRAEHPDLRVGPHYAFGACGGRAPMASFPPVATNGRLPAGAPDGAALTVGVVDTGIVLNDHCHSGQPHPWLAGRVDLLPGLGSPHATSESDEDPVAENGAGLLPPATGHGTMVAGVVLGEAPTARVRAVRAIRDGFNSDEEVAAAITKLGEEGVQLLNLSFCGDVMSEGEAPLVIEEALDSLDPGVVVVAAAGNFGDLREVWPAASPRVLAVGAVEDLPHPALAPFSNHGDWVDAYAPGVAVVGPYCWHSETGSRDTSCRAPQRFEGWARGTGSSFAAAIVTGRIAQFAITLHIEPAKALKRLLQDSPTIGVGVSVRPYITSSATIVSASD